MGVTGDRVVTEVFRIVNENPAQDLSVRAIARHLGFSSSRVSYLFKESYGSPLAVAVRALRLESAAHLLLTTPRPIKDVAHSVGFIDASHFAHSFRNHFGVSPRDFKAKSRNLVV